MDTINNLFLKNIPPHDGYLGNLCISSYKTKTFRSLQNVTE